jgi:hypothetical protein
VGEVGTGNLLRLDLSTGSFTVVASALWGMRGVSIEAGGTTAIVACAYGLFRVNLLATGVTTLIAAVLLERFAIEPGGASAITAWPGTCCGVTSQLGRVNLSTGALDVIEMPYFTLARGLVFDSTGTALYFTDEAGSGGSQATGVLFRVAAP